MISTYLTNAIVTCEEALALRESKPIVWQEACQDLGNVLQGMARFEEAIFWHSIALEKQPYLVEVYTNLGLLYARERSWKEAVISFRNAIKINPNYAEAYFYLAQIYSGHGRQEEGLELWYKSFNLKPQQADAKTHFRLAKSFQEKGKIDRAIACYQKAIRKERQWLEPYYEIGNLLTTAGQLDRAINYYQKILELDPNQALIHHKLGNIWLQQGKFEEAIAAFRTTIQLVPDFPWSYRDLVKTFLQLERWDEAIATCQAIISLVREFPWVYVHMGNALLKKGCLDEAIACFQKSCQLRGWHHPQQRNYQFAQDYFSYRIPIWETNLQHLVDRADVKAIEIGSDRAMSSCWLLDKILTHDSAKLVCLEPKFSSQFDTNIAKTEVANKVSKLEGNIHDNLASLEKNAYDLVSLQDKRKLPSHIQQNAMLAWSLLKIDGLLIFNDYQWHNPIKPENKPQIGIDKFLAGIEAEYKIVHRDANAHQLIIQKVFVHC